jgi:hypothetical protein
VAGRSQAPLKGTFVNGVVALPRQVHHVPTELTITILHKTTSRGAGSGPSKGSTTTKTVNGAAHDFSGQSTSSTFAIAVD